MYRDRIDKVVTTEQMTALDTAITELLGSVSFLQAVDPAEAKHMVKIGQKTETFAIKAIEIGKQHIGLLPRDLDLDKVERDVELRAALAIRFLQIKYLHQLMQETMMLLGTDIYSAALAIYRSLKANGKEAGLASLLAELGITFEGQRRKKSQTPDEPAEMP